MITKRHALLLVPAAALALGLTGCASIGNSLADAYSITYEVTTTSDGVASLRSVEYLEAPARGEDSETTSAASLATTPTPRSSDEPTTVRWSEVVMVTATQDASVTATPVEGATASCSILIDGTDEIAAETGAEGEPVTCSATTPAFADR